MSRILHFLRIVDEHDGMLSLTNIALIVVLFKVATANNVSVVELGTFFLALANYNAKKLLAPKFQGETP